jgi:SAM-dependent methyltransferase
MTLLRVINPVEPDQPDETTVAEEEFVAELTAHQSSLRAFILSLMPGESDVDDVLQRTNITLWRKRETFTLGTNFRAWAFEVAKWNVRSTFKDKKRKHWLVFDEELPLPDSSVDRVLMVHSLEFAENPRETLKEVWRVLAPGGRLVIVVPNRRGVWARMEHTPFGSGRPYSRGQLTALLRETNFTPGASAEALFFPPSKIRAVLRLRRGFERLGRVLWPAFSGVIVVEAQKRLYQGLPVAARASRRVFAPVLAPQGVPTTRNLSPEV